MLFWTSGPALSRSNVGNMSVTVPASLQAQPGAAEPRNHAVRHFGRMQLLRLLGKSDRSMAWLVDDPRHQQELMLVLPRVQPAEAGALARWQQGMRRAARLSHPQLAAPLEVGVQDAWPYALYDMAGASTLADHVPAEGVPGPEAATLMSQALLGLAFAHDAGIAHHDVQPYMLWVGTGGHLRVAGLAVAAELAWAARAAKADAQGIHELQAQRADAERDVLACGIVLHSVLIGGPALDEPDVGRVVACLPPYSGQARGDIVRLPWAGVQLLADPLRAIVNRATDRQERQRYRSARTLLGALEGWRQSHEGEGGPLALLAERMRVVGVLPAAPDAAARVARLCSMDRERTLELAEVALQDLALSFDLLRLVNSAQVRGAQVSGSGPVLTVRRAISMLGLDGVRHAAHALRDWPGPLQGDAEADMQRLVDRCQRAARLTLDLRPAGYDAEVVYLVCLLQNLGRLLVQYHFADEATQIRELMRSAPPARPGDAEEPGLSEEIAAYAVLGADIESIGTAVLRHWGLDDVVLTIARRLPLAIAVHAPDSDDDVLRSVASCANEAVDAMDLPFNKQAAAVLRVAQRYGRALGLDLRGLQQALQRSVAGAAAAVGRAIQAQSSSFMGADDTSRVEARV
jgi:eukaryotic-like serine/threonine-protein kinase